MRARLIAGCAMCENLLGRHAAAHARLIGACAEIGELRGRPRDLEIELAVDALFDRDFAGVRKWAARARGPRARSAPWLRGRRVRARSFGAIGLGEIADAQASREEAAARLDALDDGALSGRLDTAYYLGLRRVLLRALRRRDPPLPPRHRRLADERQGQFVIADDDRARAHAGGPRAPGRGGRGRGSRGRGRAPWGNGQMLCFALTADAWVSALRGELGRARAAGDEAMALLEGLDESVLLSRRSASTSPPHSSRRASRRAAWRR